MIVTFDFETHPIEGRPNYPPRPVGLALKVGDAPSIYYSWGHTSGNNCDEKRAKAALDRWWNEPDVQMLAHNAKFDLDVATHGWGFPEIAWDRVEDTMLLAFLRDPHARNIDLKSLADAHLSWPAEERDAVGEWCWANRARLYASTGKRVSRHSGEKVSKVWQYFAYVPGDVLAPYACGDTDRTYALYHEFVKYVRKWNMGAAYDRERRLLPILRENEHHGIRVDEEGLARTVPALERGVERVDAWLARRLEAPSLNINSDALLASALLRAGVVSEKDFVRTKSGQLSVSKDNLPPDKFLDPQVASALGYRNRARTISRNFLEPWLAQAEANEGYITTNWSQTRGTGGGSRTGRACTSSPNLLNISKSFEGRPDGYVHPAHIDVPPLPLVRSYVLPDEGDVFIRRDFSQQEFRLFAHFECGPARQTYLDDPATDFHDMVAANVRRISPDTGLDRTRVKIINFQTLYGAGITGLAGPKGLNCGKDKAREFKAFHDEALPGRAILADELTALARAGKPIRTWGGRIYFVEPPHNGMSFEYKLLNYLVQGSAADITKQAIIDWYEDPRRKARFLLTVYDEISASAPEGTWREEMALLRGHMERKRISVAMLSEGEYGPSWGSLQPTE